MKKGKDVLLVLDQQKIADDGNQTRAARLLGCLPKRFLFFRKQIFTASQDYRIVT